MSQRVYAASILSSLLSQVAQPTTSQRQMKIVSHVFQGGFMATHPTPRSGR